MFQEGVQFGDEQCEGVFFVFCCRCFYSVQDFREVIECCEEVYDFFGIGVQIIVEVGQIFLYDIDEGIQGVWLYSDKFFRYGDEGCCVNGLNIVVKIV